MLVVQAQDLHQMTVEVNQISNQEATGNPGRFFMPLFKSVYTGYPPLTKRQISMLHATEVASVY
jgi:hypothetical protein